MTEAFSVWLDLLRCMAALIVLVAHAANYRFTDGALFVVRTWTLAPDAVIVFFVLSGLVIARAAGRDGTLARFVFNRMTRLWSVVVPALILTLILDRIGLAIDTSAYRAPYYIEQPLWEVLLRGLSFTHEWGGARAAVPLGSNAPLWSLSYEFAYYTALAVAVYLRGWLRVGLLAALLALAGLPVILLAPAWIGGALVWHLLKRRAAPLSRAAGAALAIGPVVVLLALKIANVDNDLLGLTNRWITSGTAWSELRYAREALWNMVIAFGIAVHLIGMASVAPDLPAVLRRGVRWLAGASFSIYVMHYPVLHLMDAVLPEDIALKPVLFIAVPLGVCLLFAALFERSLPLQRRALRAAFRSLPKG